ncbi:MAG TPA: alpha/beta hydrolase-fold protein [Verrucomicrobiae bacterium]|nr:alpha/beta hydrolase-fold protein [Verrucomicrobiae bacterium]
MRTLGIGTVLLVLSTFMSEGTLLPVRSVESRHLGGARSVRVYLPPSYERASRRRYPVLYLHDGQNVFSSAGTNCCFGWGNWELDLTADRLIAQGRMAEIIMVGVDQSRARYKEYRGLLYDHPGQRPSASRSAASNTLDNSRFEAYTKFLIQELKPAIDREFRTRKTAEHTGVMGSSLGGLCSLALAWENPKVFGLAVSLSGSFQVENRNFLQNVLQSYEGRRKPFRVYLDSGTVDNTGDDDRHDTDAVAAEFRRIGWKAGKTLLHFTDKHPLTEPELERAGLRRDKWDEALRSQHNEFYWRQRAWRALEFLFPKK